MRTPLIIAVLIFVVGVSSQQTPPASLDAASNCTITTTKPKPAAQTYIFKTCLLVKFAGYFKIGTNQYVEIKNAQVDEVNSHCENATQLTGPQLRIKFPCGDFDFGMNRNNKLEVYFTNISGKLDVQNVTFANATEMFKSSALHYYKCNSEQSVTSGNVSLILSDFAYEAYRDVSSTDFSLTPQVCALDPNDPSPHGSLVGIGVAISLVVLVALAGVAFFVVRKRWAERSSYESV